VQTVQGEPMVRREVLNAALTNRELEVAVEYLKVQLK
jgi:hypothetical protein